MRLKVATSGKTAEINLNGALTIGRPVEELNRAVAAAIGSRVAQISLDVAKVPYADASGLGALVASRISARAAGVALTVTGARGKMKQLLDLTCLESLRRRDEPASVSGTRREAPGAAKRGPVLHLSRIIAHVA
jgi:anti-anti-sigma factor